MPAGWRRWQPWRSFWARWALLGRMISNAWWRIPRSTTWASSCWASRRRPWLPVRQDGVIAMNGAVLQMFNHGLYSAGMFFLVGVIYDRAHTRDLNAFGGLYAHPAGLRLDLDLHLDGLAGSAGSERLCLRIPGRARRLAGPDRGDGAFDDWPVLHRRVHAQGLVEGAARAAEHSIGPVT